MIVFLQIERNKIENNENENASKDDTEMEESKYREKEKHMTNNNDGRERREPRGSCAKINDIYYLHFDIVLVKQEFVWPVRSRRD